MGGHLPFGRRAPHPLHLRTPCYPLPPPPLLQVREAVAAAGKDAGCALQLASFLRVQVGEGLEAQRSPGGFAEEVQETLRSATQA